jgi:hypothetical protein
MMRARMIDTVPWHSRWTEAGRYCLPNGADRYWNRDFGSSNRPCHTLSKPFDSLRFGYAQIGAVRNTCSIGLRKFDRFNHTPPRSLCTPPHDRMKQTSRGRASIPETSNGANRHRTIGSTLKKFPSCESPRGSFRRKKKRTAVFKCADTLRNQSVTRKS